MEKLILTVNQIETFTPENFKDCVPISKAAWIEMDRQNGLEHWNRIVRIWVITACYERCHADGNYTLMSYLINSVFGTKPSFSFVEDCKNAVPKIKCSDQFSTIHASMIGVDEVTEVKAEHLFILEAEKQMFKDMPSKPEIALAMLELLRLTVESKPVDVVATGQEPSTSAASVQEENQDQDNTRAYNMTDLVSSLSAPDMNYRQQPSSASVSDDELETMSTTLRKKLDDERRKFKQLSGTVKELEKVRSLNESLSRKIEELSSLEQRTLNWLCSDTRFLPNLIGADATKAILSIVAPNFMEIPMAGDNALKVFESIHNYALEKIIRSEVFDTSSIRLEKSNDRLTAIEKKIDRMTEMPNNVNDELIKLNKSVTLLMDAAKSKSTGTFQSLLNLPKGTQGPFLSDAPEEARGSTSRQAEERRNQAAVPGGLVKDSEGKYAIKFMGKEFKVKENDIIFQRYLKSLGDGG